MYNNSVYYVKYWITEVVLYYIIYIGTSNIISILHFKL